MGSQPSQKAIVTINCVVTLKESSTFSVGSKSYVQYFTKKRITSPQSLKYGDVPIPYAKLHKFLGLHFDSPLLTWKTHIEELVRNCHRRINVMRASSSKAWGADRKTLLLIYKTFVRSKIDYGSEVYGSACTTLINKLEVIQNTALRIATGALRSTLSYLSDVKLPCAQFKPELRKTH